MVTRTFSFTPLKTAKPGDVVVFDKPSNMPVEKFKLTMMQGRSYVKINYGVLSEQEFTGGGNKCSILVTGIKQAPLGKPSKALPALPPGKPIEELHTAPLARDADLRQFWRTVFLQSMTLRIHAPESAHADCANLAVDAWNAKFGGTP